MSRVSRIVVLLFPALLLASSGARADCPPGKEFCQDAGTPPGGNWTKNPCWDKEHGDLCNKRPKACPPESKPDWKFLDDQDGKKDGQLATLHGQGAAKAKACGTIQVSKTGYYKIFDIELSESCNKQQDETGYLTVVNSCNVKGWAVEGNAKDYFVVQDSDNTPTCKKDTDCTSGQVCRKGTNLGTCCVPNSPTFMGTFLLVAGEKNKICLHHWCPVWEQAKKDGVEMGFITAGCKGINSIHFRVDTNARLCVEDTSLKLCTWGCVNGKCLPDPCQGKQCPNGFCKDGVCLKENPCAKLSCPNGCKHGRCLQPKTSPGPDGDKDGYSWAADCDDEDPQVNPGHAEVCNNAVDDDCDGLVDEGDCQQAPGGPGAGDGEAESGCSCQSPAGSVPMAGWPALLLLLMLVARRARLPARS